MARTTLLALCLSVVILAGCSTPPRAMDPSLQFAGRAVSGLTADLAELKAKACPLSSERGEGPALGVVIGMIDSMPEYVSEYGTKVNAAVRLLGAQDAEAFLKRLAADWRPPLVAPPTWTPSGARAYAASSSGQLYVADYKDNAGALEKVFANMDQGFVLEFTASIEGEDAVLTRIQPKILLCKLRRCSAVIPAAGKRLYWWEPIVTTATAATGDAPIRLKRGEMLLLTFDRFSTDQGCSRMRGLAGSNDVSEDFPVASAMPMPDLTRVAIILAAQPAPEKKPVPESSPPAAN